MKTTERLLPLVEDGLVDEVLRQLMSGKEAQVYVVRCGEAIRCAKVYKEAHQRSFKQAATYQEGRSVRNSRRARAMAKGTRFGQKEREQEWLSAEVDALYRLADAGVRVPVPYGFHHGVLLMELIVDAEGMAAPRLNEISMSAEVARDFHGRLMRDIVRMLCAGLVHGDLSEFNVLVDTDGPVIIDLPQAVNAAGNNSAKKMLERDVTNMALYFGKYAPELLETDYANEIWAHYESGTLTPDVKLTGRFDRPTVVADVETIMKIIAAAREEEMARRERMAAPNENGH